LYIFTRLGIWITAYSAGWLFVGDGTAHAPPSFMARWQQWDWSYFLAIARDGYFPAGHARDNREAFFPGFPFALRMVHTVLPSWIAAGLLISFAAGLVAVLALARIAQQYSTEDGVGNRAVLFFLLSPCAIFLAVGYSEALFLAFALPCWLAAKKGNWPLASGLACLATAVRINGLFLAAALLVLFLTSGKPRRYRNLLWLGLPVLPVAMYCWFLHSRTGDWMAWRHAEERGWYRQFHSPMQAWAHTWDNAFHHLQTTPYAWEFQLELAAAVVGIALFGLLLIRRDWPQATYIGLSLLALGTSYWYMSLPRSSLLWWPLWIVLATSSSRRPQIVTSYVCVAGPLLTILTIAFTSGRWAG